MQQGPAARSAFKANPAGITAARRRVDPRMRRRGRTLPEVQAGAVCCVCVFACLCLFVCCFVAFCCLLALVLADARVLVYADCMLIELIVLDRLCGEMDNASPSYTSRSLTFHAAAFCSQTPVPSSPLSRIAPLVPSSAAFPLNSHSAVLHRSSLSTNECRRFHVHRCSHAC